MAQRFFNNARGVLAGPVIDIDDTIVLQDHVNLPATLAAGDWFSLTVLSETSRYGSNVEIMKVTGVTVSGSNLELVVERGQDGTAVVAHDAGEKAEARITRMSIEALLADANQHTTDAVNALLDAAPGALDTLNELAAALGDDPNFASTMTAALSDKVSQSHLTDSDPHAQYELKTALKAAAYREVLGGIGPLMAQGYSGIGSTGREIGNGEAINLKALGRGFYFANRPASDGVTGLPSYIPDVYSLNIPMVGSSPSSIINSVLTILPTLRRIVLGVSDGTETGLTPFEVYTAASIVGTVSESDGVPTGAVIESDSDSFGSWTYLADGTLEMVVNTIHTDVAITTTGVTEGSLYRSSELSIPLPKPIAFGSETGFSIELNSGAGAMIASSIGRTRISGNTLYFTVVAGSSIGVNTFATSAIVKTRWFN